MPGTHFALRIDKSEIETLADSAIDLLARRLAATAFKPLPSTERYQGSAESIGALAYLHALVHLQRAVERRANAAAEYAASAGAGYPDLGKVCNISRQGARRRWPGIVASQRRQTPTSDRSGP